MTKRAPRVCSAGPCQQVATANGRCSLHQKRPDTHRKYGTEPGQVIYRTATWQRLRVAFLSEQPLCQSPGCRALATEVDHIVAHKGDRSIAFDWDNLQSLCKSCHSRKTTREDGGFGRQPKPDQAEN